LERVAPLTLTDPPVEATHWTGAMMAEAIGFSVISVQRIWRAHGLQPHRVRQFKLSNDPKFVDKLRDVVGLYVEALAPLWATGGFLSPMGELVGAGALMLAGCPEDSPF
jgi:hypothetical protein